MDNEEIKHSKLLGSTKNKSCSACKVDPTLAFDHAVLIKRYECKASACYMNIFIKNAKTTDRLSKAQFYNSLAPYFKSDEQIPGLAEDSAFVCFLEQDDVGIGSATDPLCLMLTSKALLQNIAINSENGVFHLDATHSTSRVGYNLFVGGISDRRGHFYPAFVAISSHVLPYRY